jgi:hypothetical protein
VTPGVKNGKLPRKHAFGNVARSENTPLTSQQKEFVRQWASGESVTTAAARAGYEVSANYGQKLKVMPHIRKAYDKLAAQYAEEAQLNREDVITGLKDAIEMAKLMSEPATMIAGWREIGKLCGFYEPKKVDINVNVNGSVVLERMGQMSDAELLKIINEASNLGVEQAGLLLDHEDGDETPD